MWIFTKYGFFSVVSARTNAWSKDLDLDKLMVRAREKNHLINLIDDFKELDNLEILETQDSDYRYRIFVEKQIWSNIIMKITNDIDYDNFKNKVYSTMKDKDFYHSLGDVWSVMYNYQNRHE